ncbi:MAG: hypothetical protein PHY93_07245 [Bacteriovorax sp.]|nr:hypothetical protein [Bacteriovorax sp.]
MNLKKIESSARRFLFVVPMLIITGVHASTSDKLIEEGRYIFRYDTFGSEHYWGDQLKLHDAIKGQKNGGVGPGLSPKGALKAGLKVDIGKLPDDLIKAIKANTVNLDDPDTTVALLKLDSIVGVKGIFDGKVLKSVGIQCALCHSTVDNSLTEGIGNRLDGWPNRDLNVGAVVAMAPNLKPIQDALGADNATVKTVLLSWGPGKYDAELNVDGKAFRPDGKSGATLLPAAFGLAGVNLHTYTGWGSVPYWNAYVAVTQMHGQGTFFDSRLNNNVKYPLAVKNGTWDIRNKTDLVTSKLAALQHYQLSLQAPKPDDKTFNKEAASRGQIIFEGKAKCISCHVPPLYTEPGWNMHSAQEIGIDNFQASRSPDGGYRTTPLKGLFVREKGGFYHDGRFATYRDVINHYDNLKHLDLSNSEKEDLEDYLRSL